MKLIMIITTVPDIEVGKKIAAHLIEKNLAACVNIIPQVISLYKWKNKIESDSELILLIKSARAKETHIYKKIKDMHPYEIPEIITLEIKNSDEAYTKWIFDSIK